MLTHYGDTVQLTANANPGWTFSAWSGDMSGSTNPDTITMDGNKTVTATFTQGGGSVGGGGGGGIPEGVTFFVDKVNPTGKFVEDIIIQSRDKKVTIIIKEGTIGKTIIGIALAWVSIQPENDFPVPRQYFSMISRTYDVTPNGATFEPAATIIFKYDPSEILKIFAGQDAPEGINEEDLYIATLDEETSQWVPLVSHVDPETNTIWAEISHFSLYAVMISVRPADISATELNITPGKIYEGEGATVTALLTNNGDITAIYEAKLEVDGIIMDSKEVEIPGNDSITISFDLTGLAKGNYKIAIGEITSTITVMEIDESIPATFTFSPLEITPDELYIGKNVDIATTVTNIGDIEGICRMVCKINGIIVDEKEIALAGGMRKTVIFSICIEEAGLKTIQINELVDYLIVKEVIQETEEEEEEGEEIGEVADIPTQVQEEVYEETGWLSEYWWTIVLVLGICVFIAVLVILSIHTNWFKT